MTDLCPGPAEFKCCFPEKHEGSEEGGKTKEHELSEKGAEFIAGFEGFRKGFYTDAAVSVAFSSFLLWGSRVGEIVDAAYGDGCRASRRSGMDMRASHRLNAIASPRRLLKRKVKIC